MTTDGLGGCSSGPSHDAWPPDSNHDGDTDIGDVIALFNGKMLDPSLFSARSDFSGDGDVDVGDVIIGFGGGKILTRCSVFTFTNGSGAAVDDVHIQWVSPIAQVFSARDSQLQGWSGRALSGDGLTLDMDRPDPLGDLPPGGLLTVVVRGSSPGFSSCEWTLDGVNQGGC